VIESRGEPLCWRSGASLYDDSRESARGWSDESPTRRAIFWSSRIERIRLTHAQAYGESLRATFSEGTIARDISVSVVTLIRDFIEHLSIKWRHPPITLTSTLRYI
jgi:hypothetical protein